MKAKFRRTCARKVRFGTREEAERTGRMHGHHAYECPVCDGWHLTKVPQRGVNPTAPAAVVVGQCAVCGAALYPDGSEVHAGYCVELAALRKRVEALEAKSE